MLAVLADMDTRLLERQAQMYASDLTFDEKWAQATAFYKDDLASGYVRLLLELYAIGFSNAAVGTAVRALHARWRRVLTVAASQALDRFGIAEVAPEEVATAVMDFWLGMEFEMTVGVPEDDGHHWRTVETFRRILARLEARENPSPHPLPDSGRG